MLRGLLTTFLLLVGCSDSSFNGLGKAPSDSSVSETTANEPPKKPASDGAATGDDSIVDVPVPVGGSFLYCFANVEQSVTTGDQEYGCRVQAAGKKISVPPEADASFAVAQQGGAMQGAFKGVRQADSEPWHWLVKIPNPAKKALDIELTLGKVAVTTASGGLVISSGAGVYKFAKTNLGGSLNRFGGQLVYDYLSSDNPQVSFDMKGVLSTFPAYLRVKGEGKASGRVILSGPDAKTPPCRYDAQEDSNYYFFSYCDMPALQPGYVTNFYQVIYHANSFADEQLKVEVYFPKILP